METVMKSGGKSSRDYQNSEHNSTASADVTVCPSRLFMTSGTLHLNEGL